MSEFIYLIIGIGLGVLFAMNHKEFKEMKTIEELDAELRKELDFLRNTVTSQRLDVEFYRHKAKTYQDKYESIQK
jgi:hypothetical protein